MIPNPDILVVYISRKKFILVAISKLNIFNYSATVESTQMQCKYQLGFVTNTEYVISQYSEWSLISALISLLAACFL